MPRRPMTPTFGLLQLAIILATLFTAAVHVYLAVAPSSPEPQLRVLFGLAALGYLGALMTLYGPPAFLDPFRWLARLALIAVTVSAIVAYVLVVGFVFDTLSLIDKSVEAALVAALVLDGLRSRRAKAEPSQEERQVRHLAA
jgi:hypothetical protein